jgi:tRNA threonylcarbamoyladenosine biosynthesis protein TsaE
MTIEQFNCLLPDEAATVRFGALLARATMRVEYGLDVTQGTSLGGRVFLSGDLGAGKTTLTRGVLRGYGFQGAVKSPTYTLVEPYEEPSFNIYHFDLYRLADPEEVEFLGVFDYFDKKNLCLIEWAEKGDGFLPCPDLKLALLVEGRSRRIQWQPCTAHGEKIASRLLQLIHSQSTGTQQE